MESAQSFTARRSAASNLPAFQLPPPDHLSQLHKYPAYAPSSQRQPSSAVISSVLTPPAGVPSDALSPLASSVNSGSSQSSAAGVPPYQPMGYWPTPQNPSYTFNSAPPMPASHAQHYAQQQQGYVGRPLYSPSIEFPSRDVQSRDLDGEHLPPPPYDMSLPPFPTSTSGGNDLARPRPPQGRDIGWPQQEQLTDFRHTVSAQPHSRMGAPQGYSYSRPAYGSYNLPAMAGPIMSYVHNPPNQMAFVGGMTMQHQMGEPMYGHHPGQLQQQNDRPFKCDQCPQSFNRNHDLKRHKRIHIIVKRFPCGHCEKSFSRKEALKRHILVKGCGRAKSIEADSELDCVPEIMLKLEKFENGTWITSNTRGNPQSSIELPDVGNNASNSTTPTPPLGPSPHGDVAKSQFQREAVTKAQQPAKLEGSLLAEPLSQPPLAPSPENPPPPTSMASPSKYRCHCGFEPYGNDAYKTSNLKRHQESRAYRRSPPFSSRVESLDASPCTHSNQVVASSLSDRIRLPSSPGVGGSPTTKDSEASHADSSPGYDTLASITDDDTDWGEDESTDAHVYHFSKSGEAACEEMNQTLIQPLLSPFKQELIGRIMKEFWIIFNQENETIQVSNTGAATIDANEGPVLQTFDGGDNSSRTPAQDSSVNRPETSSHRECNENNKRQRDDQDEQDRNDGEDKSPKRPRTLLSPPQNQDDSSKFACPYRKRDPRKYCVQHWRSCALTPLETLARVKGHLYRHHRIFPCQRCKTLFEDQNAVNTHLMEPKACELKNTTQTDGVTSEIYEKLRSKKKAQRNQTEAERWKDIYKLLFPNEMIPSPYFEPVQEDLVLSPDSRELADYEDYCRRELPQDFRAALEEIVHNESQPIEESIRNQLMNIIRDCQDRVFTRYRSSGPAASGTPLRNRTSLELNMLRPAEMPGTMANSSLHATTWSETSFRADLPPFFQPPTPQHDLQSRLEVSEFRNASPKIHESTQQSDSGYGSNVPALRSSPSSSLSNSFDRGPLSSPQPFVNPTPTVNFTDGVLKMGNTQDQTGATSTSSFESFWMECDLGAVDGTDWNSYLSMESPPYSRDEI